MELIATDLEVTAKVLLKAQISEPGKFCINTKNLSDILRELPDDSLNLKIDKGLWRNEKFDSGTLDISFSKNRMVVENCHFKSGDDYLLLSGSWLSKNKYRIDRIQSAYKDNYLVNNYAMYISCTMDINKNISSKHVSKHIKDINNIDIKIKEECLKKEESIVNINKKIENLNKINSSLLDCKSIVDLIDKTLNEEAPVNLSKGNVIKSNFNSELDQLRDLTICGKNYLDEILEREKRIDLYKDCLKFLKTRVELDLALFKDDIWSH